MTEESRLLAICEEYGTSVKGYTADGGFVVSFVMDVKYFREVFDRMKELGYTCAVAKRVSPKLHKVTFSPTDLYEEDCSHNTGLE